MGFLENTITTINIAAGLLASFFGISTFTFFVVVGVVFIVIFFPVLGLLGFNFATPARQDINGNYVANIDSDYSHNRGNDSFDIITDPVYSYLPCNIYHNNHSD